VVCETGSLLVALARTPGSEFRFIKLPVVNVYTRRLLSEFTPDTYVVCETGSLLVTLARNPPGSEFRFINFSVVNVYKSIRVQPSLEPGARGV